MTNPLPDVDVQALTKDLSALGAELRASSGPEDLAHLRKIERWGRLASGFGFVTAWTLPNPLTIFALAIGSFVRWAVVAHHVSHKGYDRVADVPKRYRSTHFAKGWRRWVDWADWMHPDAWNLEHGTFHHYRLGEEADPDLPERNLEWLRQSSLPMWLRQLFVFGVSLVWKPVYYAPNTLRVLLNHQAAKEEGDAAPVPFYDRKSWSPFGGRVWQVATRCWLPYIGYRFILLPALFLPFGTRAAAFALVNLVLAELLTNAWSFWVIVPNHAGDDLYRFDEPARGRGEFFLRQILGSTNYRTGGDLNDILHGWLNYQVEHHVFPEISALQCRAAHPRVKEICARHGVPFIEDSIFRRMGKTMDLLTGRTSLKRWPLTEPDVIPTAA